MKGWLNIMKKKKNRTNWKNKIKEDFGENIQKIAQKTKGYYRYEDIYNYYKVLEKRNTKLQELTKLSHYINFDMIPQISFNLTKGGLKTKTKILEKNGFKFDEKTLHYKENYISMLKELNFSNDLIDKIRYLTNEQILIFSTFFSSTIEYLYLQDNVKEKETIINNAIDDVLEISNNLDKNNDINDIKEQIAKRKFKKYGVK